MYHRPFMYLKDRSILRTNFIYFRTLFSKTELTSQHLHGRDCFMINLKTQCMSRQVYLAHIHTHKATDESPHLYLTYYVCILTVLTRTTLHCHCVPLHTACSYRTTWLANRSKEVSSLPCTYTVNEE